MGGELCTVAALRLEALAIGGEVVVSGMGRDRASATARRLARDLPGGRPVAFVGVTGVVEPGLRPGDIVVGSTVRAVDGAPAADLRSAGVVAAGLRHAGLTVRSGTLLSSPVMARGPRRSALSVAGALAVDRESAWLAATLVDDHPLAVVRVVAETSHDGIVSGGWRALGSLRRLRGPLEGWARATGSRRVVLAGPRSFCAGVERAIDIVERALDRFGTPVYVRRQIVHNSHVVEDLARKGAVFVEELDEVPEGSTVVLAAHGVTPEVRAEAELRSLMVVDATCPLVAKVHHEARRFAGRGYSIVLVGHSDHEEVVGTRGEASDSIHVVQDASDVAVLDLRDPERVAYLTQTTLAIDETADIIRALRQRFPRIEGPRSDDICYATQNRQEAVQALSRDADVMLVVGSRNSSNTARLAEVAERAGCPAHLLEDGDELDPAWLIGCETVGITAGASAPELLVQGVVDAVGSLGPVEVTEGSFEPEDVTFTLPPEVR